MSDARPHHTGSSDAVPFDAGSSDTVPSGTVSLALAAPVAGPPRAPVLVLGNSLGTSAAVWDRQVPDLEQSFALVRYELPGHGGSARPSGPYTIAGLGAGVLALLDSLGVERAGYCGISLGGMIGMWLAANAPDRITALGLVCTSAYLPPAGDWRQRAARVRRRGHGFDLRCRPRPLVHPGYAAGRADRHRSVPGRT